jgi:paraquat-inducible protein A
MGMALFFLLLAAMPVYQIITRTDSEIEYIKKAYDTNSFQNNGAIKEAEVWKEISKQHHFLGPIANNFFGPALNKQFHIPPLPEAREALAQIPSIKEEGIQEADTARFWSLVLLLVSLTYVGLSFNLGGKANSDYIFALTITSVVFLVLGILAPAMILVVSPKTDMFPHFILKYEVRSIFGVIMELYHSSYWVVAVCLTVFSMLIPFAKACLSVFILESADLSQRLKIAKFLHDISKWSMADVFVAAVLLSSFAVKANKSTHAELFLGFYFFLGYCLLSLVTTTLLQNKVAGVQEKSEPQRKKPSKASR